MTKEIVVATRNKDKLKEIKEILKGLPVKVLSLDDFNGVPEVIEDGMTLEENAIKKSKDVSLFLKKLVIADDSGIEIRALDNAPGVYSARFSGKGATYRSNNELVLKLLKKVPIHKRNACFRCIMAVYDRGEKVGIVEGRCLGKITLEPKGSSGFGYDPIFKPRGLKYTFAELDMSKKNRISHRGKALRKARKMVIRYLSKS